MTREQLEHIIRAAASIAEDDDIVIIGSQAILGQFPEAPEALLQSNEADVFPRTRVERSDVIDGAIGELSPFHKTFSYYAQGVGPGTAVLAPGWEARLVPIRGPRTHGATGWCLEVHDLLLSKYVAGREKDLAFTHVAVAHGLADRAVLLERLKQLPVDETQQSLVRGRIERDFAAVAD